MAKFEKGLPRPLGAGRKAGTPNKTTKEIREVLSQVIDDNSQNLQGWLTKVAEDDPARALELYLKMAEYVIPKLSRTEHIGSANITFGAILREISQSGSSAGLPNMSEEMEALRKLEIIDV